MSRASTLAVFALGALLGAFVVAAPVVAQDDPDKTPVKEKPKEKGKKSKPGELKKYEDVVTDKAKTTKGLFIVHRIDDKVYFEIPTSAYGKLMLWTTEVAKAPSGVGWGGKALGNVVVRWERRGNKVLLWQVFFDKRADGKAIQRAVDSANHDSIIMALNIETEGKDKTAVVHATPLFTADVAELNVKNAVPGGAGIDDSRSFLEQVKVFPSTISARSLLSFRSGGGGAPAGPGPKKFKAAPGGRSISVVVHHSVNLLPERPMQGRYFDPRVGYFTRSFEDYASDKTWMVKRQYIARFRLEKKDPEAAVSEPAKPILFYISREVPEKWRMYLKQGVEDWRPAFEKAGFKNAIICKIAPTPEEDPNWDPEDGRHSVIRWVADPTQNAMGPHVHDPRSGEIISAHIIFWHDILKLVQQWYFVQCGASDARAQKLPLPDEVTGELLRYVSAHEVGHTLGLRHNHRASSAYTVAQLRDPEFTNKHGTVASIMSYGRFNYVAQPEDKVTTLIPKLGPYDYFAIEWGYKPVAGAMNPEAERPTLDQWASRQLDEPWLRFGGEDGPASVDPTVKTENISTDSIEATLLGLKNLDRVADLLIPATTRLGEDYTLLQEAYKAMLTHRNNWFNAVALMVGGVVESRTLGGRGGDSFTRLPRKKQQDAVRFLLENALSTPRKVVQPALVNRFKYFGVADEVMSQQKALLRNLLSGKRFRLLMDAEVIDPAQAYTAMQFLTDVQDGVWSEAKASLPAVDVFRRHLQRAYLDLMKDELGRKDGGSLPGLDGDPFAPLAATTQGTDFRAVARAALQELDTLLAAALGRAQDPMTRLHYRDCRREIELILNPKGG